jgi:hypothetical protein
MTQAENIKNRVAIPSVIRSRIVVLAGRIAAAHMELEVADRERQQWIAELQRHYGMVDIDEITGVMWVNGPVANQEE